MNRMKRLNHGYITVKFEHLTDLQEPEVAVNEMRKIAEYLYSDEYFKINEDAIMHRIKCLVNELMPIDYERFGDIHRANVDPNIYLTFDRAYKYFIDNCFEISLGPSTTAKNVKNFKDTVLFYNYSLPDKNYTNVV